MNKDLIILDKLGITNGEAAELFEVNRGTIANWKAGRPPLTKMVYNNALKICDALGRAKLKGLLPLIEVRKSERIQLYKNIIDLCK